MTLAALLAPELRESTLAVAEAVDAMPTLSRSTLPGYREAMAQWAGTPLDDVPVARQLIARRHGPDLAVYVVNARPDTRRPAVLHMHGGGFVSGAATFEVRRQQELAAALDCVCVTVDYRLAPETRWRGSLEDNYAALCWLHRHADELGADPSRIAVMGESAGGGHAALLALAARDRGEVPLVLQLLIYPMLDDRTASSRRVAPHIGRTIWTPEANRYAWRAFLGTAPGGPSVPRSAVPARVAQLGGVAPAFIGVGALDLFVQENVAYAQRLMQAGVATELHVVPGAVHGFDDISPGTAIVREFMELKLNALRRAFGIPVIASGDVATPAAAVA